MIRSTVRLMLVWHCAPTAVFMMLVACVSTACAEDLLTLENQVVKVRIDRDRGAAITWLSSAGYPKNIVNLADPGRLVQQSYYAGKSRDRLAEGQSKSWATELNPPGLVNGGMSKATSSYFDFYLDGKPPAALREKFDPNSPPKNDENDSKGNAKGWIARNGKAVVQNGALSLLGGKGAEKRKRPFLVRSGIKFVGPVTATIRVKSSQTGEFAIAWRTAQQKDFLPGSRVAVSLTASDQWQTHEVKITAEGNLIHLRVQMPANSTQIGAMNFVPATGRSVKSTNWRCSISRPHAE